ncbi:ATP-dependent DNA helicase [Trichonephila clavata]|uniref:ATP-dependent DNA helicase n=1 Tax=Trichonephila clavata TaxID=2740835 RepID=A0A8X6FEK1_TRICU|nr:ATP-dependent DNA helicase [Trichonephila clavata]
MNLITKGKIFGVAQCYMYTIEWQKRGLPHAHILVWLQETLQVHKVDDFISAEIPNPEEDPELFNCITTHGTWSLRSHQSFFSLHEEWKMY